MKAIVAVDENWAIGKMGRLLAHIPEDLKYFKKNTMGQIIVYGRKTLGSFPGGKPLSGRTNVILTNREKYSDIVPGATKQPDNVTIVNTAAGIRKIKQVYQSYNRDVFICGGESVYKQFIGDVDEALVTKILATFEADKHFPNLDEDENFKLVWESDVREENGVRYKFTRYERKKAEETE